MDADGGCAEPVSDEEVGKFLADRSEKSPLTEYDLRIASHTRNIMERLCGDLDKLYKHID